MFVGINCCVVLGEVESFFWCLCRCWEDLGDVGRSLVIVGVRVGYCGWCGRNLWVKRYCCYVGRVGCFVVKMSGVLWVVY